MAYQWLLEQMTVGAQKEVIRKHEGEKNLREIPGVRRSDVLSTLRLIRDNLVAIEPKEVVAELGFLLRDNSTLVGSGNVLLGGLYLDSQISLGEFYHLLESADIPETVRTVLLATRAQAHEAGTVSGIVAYHFPVSEKGESATAQHPLYRKWLAALITVKRRTWRMVAEKM